MTTALLLETRRSTDPLRVGATAPQVTESSPIRLTGLPSGTGVTLAGVELRSDANGTVEVVPKDDDRFEGHVGLVEVLVEGRLVGEIEIIPDKFSEPQYQRLRAELQRVWTDLVFDPVGAASVEAGPPPANVLWQRLRPHVASILEHPSETLRIGQGVRRFDQVRRASELTPAVLRTRDRGGSALSRVLERSSDTAESHLAGATLALLRNHARRSDPDLARHLERLLTNRLFARADQPVARITWGMRSDRRYREFLAVHRLLRRPELAPTEGPGELRLGVKALPRLYEYWAFLQVLLAAIERYGQPLTGSLDQLAVPTGGNRRRLELVPGTTVTFPGDIHVAFEPSIRANGRGWMDLEYVPHPDPERSQLRATPDVVVFRATERPWLTVFDAKYVGRSWVEMAATRTHEKYARMRWHGNPVVRDVLVLHPHVGLSARWSGYGHTWANPDSTPPLPLPLAGGADAPTPTRSAVDRPDRPERSPRSTPRSPEADRSEATTAVGGGPVTVVADQYWMHQQLGSRRIDLRDLSAHTSRPAASRRIVVMPRLGQLISFAAAAEARGWEVHWTDSYERADQLEAIREIIAVAQRDGTVTLVSADPALAQHIRPVDRVFSDLDLLPDL